MVGAVGRSGVIHVPATTKININGGRLWRIGGLSYVSLSSWNSGAHRLQHLEGVG